MLFIETLHNLNTQDYQTELNHKFIGHYYLDHGIIEHQLQYHTVGHFN